MKIKFTLFIKLALGTICLGIIPYASAESNPSDGDLFSKDKKKGGKPFNPFCLDGGGADCGNGGGTGPKAIVPGGAALNCDVNGTCGQD